MIYSEKISGKYTYLRQVQVEDAEFILSLRTDPVYSLYINDTENDLDIQIEWIKQQYTKPYDYYFVICDLNHHSKGVISLYNFDSDKINAEMGRLICPKAQIQLYETLILIHDFAFDRLGLTRLFYKENPENYDVIAVTRKFGAEFVREGSHANSNLKYMEFQIKKVNWPELRVKNNMRLEKYVMLINRSNENIVPDGSLNSINTSIYK